MFKNLRVKGIVIYLEFIKFKMEIMKIRIMLSL